MASPGKTDGGIGRKPDDEAMTLSQKRRAAGMNTRRLSLLAPALGVVALVGGSAGAAPAAKVAAPSYNLRVGQELTFPASIVDGKVVLGPPHLSKLGAATPGTGEITVGLTPADKGTLYAHIVAVEKTAVPIDFVATGLIGSVKIDERVVCGRLENPISAHIGSVSWVVALRDFEVGKGGGTCD